MCKTGVLDFRYDKWGELGVICKAGALDLRYGGGKTPDAKPIPDIRCQPI